MTAPRFSAGTASTERPSNSTSPEVGSSSPAIIRRVVVLPQPEGPSSATTSPDSMSMLRSSTPTTDPNRLGQMIRLTLVIAGRTPP